MEVGVSGRWGTAVRLKIFDQSERRFFDLFQNCSWIKTCFVVRFWKFMKFELWKQVSHLSGEYNCGTSKKIIDRYGKVIQNWGNNWYINIVVHHSHTISTFKGWTWGRNHRFPSYINKLFVAATAEKMVNIKKSLSKKRAVLAKKNK